MMIALAIIYMFWTKHKYAQGIQTLSPMIPIPLWAWVWTSLFAPVYACHLFPPDVVEQATSPRIMRLIRRKPKVVNTLCYGGPVIIGLPITGLSAIWASRNALARERGINVAQSRKLNCLLSGTTMSAHDTYVAGVVYQSLYALWALIFLGTAAVSRSDHVAIAYLTLPLALHNIFCSPHSHITHAIVDSEKAGPS